MTAGHVLWGLPYSVCASACASSMQEQGLWFIISKQCHTSKGRQLPYSAVGVLPSSPNSAKRQSDYCLLDREPGAETGRSDHSCSILLSQTCVRV